MDTAGADDQTRLLFARRMLKGSAALLLLTIAANTWAVLQQQLIAEFDQQVDRQVVYRQLATRKLMPGESTRQYILSVQTMAMHADITERELISCIIDGLDDSSIAITLVHQSHNMAALKSMLTNYDKYRLRPQPKPVVRSTVNRPPNVAAPNAPVSNVPTPINQSTETVRNRSAPLFQLPSNGSHI